MRARRRSRGLALLALVAVMAMVATSWLVTSVTTASNRTASKRMQNAQALRDAKSALLGWAARNATDDANPGRLPCPEPAAAVGNDSAEGIAAPNPGVASSCTDVGRLPWKTIGLDKVLDADGEPLWYVVASGWHLANSSSVLGINSNSTSTLTIDGAGNSAVAVIIAPGAALNVAPTAAQTAAGCATRTQDRSAAPSDYREYIECHNPGANTLVSGVTGNGANTVFNDQIVVVTAAEVLAAVEAPVADRIRREVAPALASVYTSAAGWSNAEVLFPFAAPFASPESASYQGSVGQLQGLLPIATATTGSITWTSPATANVQQTGGTGTLLAWDCGNSTSTRLDCRVYYTRNDEPSLSIGVSATGIGTGFRMPPGLLGNLTSSRTLTTSSISNALQNDGTALVTINALMPRYTRSNTTGVRIRLDVNAADHTVTDSNDATTGWFVRNGWHRLVYYAVSPGFAPGGGGSCTGGGTPACITVSNSTAPTDAKRAVLVFAGRPLGTTTRPSAALADYFEEENASVEAAPSQSVFQTVATASTTINDRVVVVAP